MIPEARGLVAKTLKYKDAQEYLLRRLASAVILQWDQLPNDLQDLLIDQATIVSDKEDAPHARSDIETFVRFVKVSALPKPTT